MRRGATMIVAAPAGSRLARLTASPATTLIPAVEADPLSAAVAVLSLLGDLGLGPEVHTAHVADAADLVAEACAPGRDLSDNPGKELALCLADTLPLIWGGTVLAGRASRRIAEAVRRACGRPALAADAAELDTLLCAVKPRDPFLLDDDKLIDRLSDVADRLARWAESVGVRVARISSGDADLALSDVERYVTLLQRGLYGAAYLEIGLAE